jgi:hypothetical protein
MRRILTIIIALAVCSVAGAQYIVSDKYDLWFEDTGHEETTRKAVTCDEDYQDLWNGCYVRISGRTVYIYRDGSSILYGDEINLLYNGCYRVKRSGTWYLADEDGDLVDGIYGKDITYYPRGYVAVLRSSGYWDIFHCSGRKVETYSYENPRIYYNGCWGVRQGSHWYACDGNGDKIDGVYGDRITLLGSGKWKCVRGSYVTYVDP